jgi:hypothetical protein
MNTPASRTPLLTAQPTAHSLTRLISPDIVPKIADGLHCALSG